MQYDYAIIGSGFGGSVSALRLSEKGYKVLVIEKGSWFKGEDFPKTNWELKKWLWEPRLGLRGFFKMTFLNHVSIVSGVGVGGGSLTYACTLPVPKKEFFNSGSWKNLADWEQELAPFYKTAYRMLGAATNPRLFDADESLRQLAREIGKEDDFGPTKVSVFFGQPGETVPDPFFGGKGPSRTGCIHCGACMTGCRHNAKNSLDKNYLYLAQQLGAEILAEKEVYDLLPLDGQDGSTGYCIRFKPSIKRRGEKSGEVTAKGVIFAGGVLGTVPLLLRLKEKSLPRLSGRIGCQVRTNNESLILVTSLAKDNRDFSKGLAIGSILHTDHNSHLEPTRYGEGSSFFKTMTIPMVKGSNVLVRLARLFFKIMSSPLRVARAVALKNYASKTTILLFMQTLDSTIRIKRGWLTKMKTVTEEGPAPDAFIPEAWELAKKYERIVDGISFVNFADVILGNPTTAHILGGAVMGENADEGVIDSANRVFGYQNMLVCDGSMISANPGVNPALSITAISERAMSLIPPA